MDQQADTSRGSSVIDSSVVTDGDTRTISDDELDKLMRASITPWQAPATVRDLDELTRMWPSSSSLLVQAEANRCSQQDAMRCETFDQEIRRVEDSGVDCDEPSCVPLPCAAFGGAGRTFPFPRRSARSDGCMSQKQSDSPVGIGRADQREDHIETQTTIFASLGGEADSALDAESCVFIAPAERVCDPTASVDPHCAAARSASDPVKPHGIRDDDDSSRVCPAGEGVPSPDLCNRSNGKCESVARQCAAKLALPSRQPPGDEIPEFLSTLACSPRPTPTKAALPSSPERDACPSTRAMSIHECMQRQTGHMVVLIASKASEDTLRNINHLRRIFAERRLQWAEIDGSDPANAELQRELLRISTRRANYPQIFFRDKSGGLVFIGACGKSSNRVIHI